MACRQYVPKYQVRRRTASTFENAIGVPQATFTTAFLEAARNRKNIFDNILKVEEYKTAFDNLLPVTNAIKKTIEEMEREIIRLQRALRSILN